MAAAALDVQVHHEANYAQWQEERAHFQERIEDFEKIVNQLQHKIDNLCKLRRADEQRHGASGRRYSFKRPT